MRSFYPRYTLRPGPSGFLHGRIIHRGRVTGVLARDPASAPFRRHHRIRDPPQSPWLSAPPHLQEMKPYRDRIRRSMKWWKQIAPSAAVVEEVSEKFGQTISEESPLCLVSQRSRD